MRIRYALAALFFCVSGANAQGLVSSEKTYDEKLRAFTLQPLSGDMFGDLISLKDGSLHFRQVDVDVPTNSGLKVEFVRRTPRNKQGADNAQFPLGMGWELDIPYMMGTFDTRRGWDAMGGGRCSSPDLGPTQWVGPSPNYNTRVMPAHLYWSGAHISLPGVGYQKMLKLMSGHTSPTDGAVYNGAANGFWRVSCLSTIQNGTGEGFVVRTPDGTKYYFNWMATRNAYDVLEKDSYRNSAGDGTDPTGLLVPTTDVFLYATKVEDRYGNYVNYNFDAVNKHRLTSIVSSDGARIDVSYNQGGQVSQVSAGGKIWSYAYEAMGDASRLIEVTRPDQSKWTFSGAVPWWYRSPQMLPGGFYSNNCAQDATGYRSQDPATPAELVMTHPSGARGAFKVRTLIHGSDNTPGGCGLFGSSMTSFWFGSYGVPSAYAVLSLVEKRIGGPGQTDQVWSYTYQPSWSFTRDCSAGCSSTTRMTDPAGDVTEYKFGNSYTSDIGLLLQETISRAGIVRRTTKYEYAQTASPYPSHYGEIISGYQGLAELYGNPVTNMIRPQVATEIAQDGITFRTTNSNFDQFARPRQITRTSASSLGGTPGPSLPSAPTLTAPNSVQRGTTFNVSWSASTGATSYALEGMRANQSTFSELYAGTATSRSLAAGLPVTSPLALRVKACNSVGCSAYSVTRYVNITGGVEP